VNTSAVKPLAHLYVADGERAAIVVPMHKNFAGIYYEQESPAVVKNWRDPHALGEVVRDALARFSVVDRDLSDGKKSDWPAFKVSGAKTIKAFEKDYLRIEIAGLNETGTYCDATVQPPGERDIRLQISYAAWKPESEIGGLILRLIDKAYHWQP